MHSCACYNAYHARMARRYSDQSPSPASEMQSCWLDKATRDVARAACVSTWLGEARRAQHSPNQVLTHAARAAAEQLNFQPPALVAARGAREGLWLEQRAASSMLP